MTKSVITLNISNKIEDARAIFEENNIKHIPVVNHKEIVGMISYSDILKISYAELTDDDKDVEVSVYDWFTIEQVMTKNLYIVAPHTSI
ncbi:MAG: CBS domain-containing protein, partial [Polaribacter sp.]|nr:CBS domain-containing protein [Polaribacter sp.]